MYVLKERGRNEMIISYKTIYINIYTLNVINLESENMIFRHESFCLWESTVYGFLNSSTLDFITLDSKGLAVMALSDECENGMKEVRDRKN